MRNATQEERWDRERDYRKHDFPARLDKPLTTAMDIVVLVKAMPNYTEAAALIDQYAGMIAAGARADEALLRLQNAGGSDAQA
jgi:hypothetical protein